MRFHIKVPAVASVMAVAALSIQGLSPATAAEGDPQASASATPAVPGEAAPEASDEAPVETEDVPSPPAGDTEGLIDVTVGESTTPVSLDPLDYYNLATIIQYNLSESGYSWTGDQYDGSAVGVFIDANVLDLLKVKSRKVAAANVPKSAGGNSDSHEVAKFSLNGFFFAPGVEIHGIESNAKSAPLDRFNDRLEAQSSVKIARLEAGELLVEGIDVSARAGQDYYSGQTDDDAFSASTQMHVTRLKSGTQEYQDYDVPPNTTYTISGLGKVVLNEQKITELPGERYAAKVNAIRITLTTAGLGLPIGTNIYIGSAEAVVNL